MSASALADINEGFDDITTLAGNGWSRQNLSDNAQSNWFQGDNTVFLAQAGAATNSYIGANYQMTSGTTGTETLSAWLITPNLTLKNGDTFSFWTRTTLTQLYPDRLEIRASLNGASTDVGTTSTSVGDFTTLMGTINPNLGLGTGTYPTAWTLMNYTISGLGAPTSGRLAFRYFVTNGGVNGLNSDYIGIDTFNYTAVPEPATLATLGLGAVAFLRRRRRRSK